MNKKIKQNKGITLIALIITIVVLLILAVVTINAVNEGGIFTHTQNAANKQTIAAEKEEIQLAVSEWKMEKYSGNSPDFVTFMNTRLSGKATVVSNGDNTYSVTFSKTGNEYTVNENGNIDGPKVVTPGITISPATLTVEPEGTGTLTATFTGGLSGTITWQSSDTSVVTVSGDNATCTVTAVTGITEGNAIITASIDGTEYARCTITVGESNLSDLEKYILGADGQGRILGGESASGGVTGILDMENCTFLVDPDDSNSTVYQNVKWGYIGDDYETIYIRYGRDIYNFKMTEIEEGKDTDDDSDDAYYFKSVAGSLSGPTTPSGNLGKYATYNGERYIVMAEDSSTVTLISANALGTVPLGRNDAGAIAAVPTAGETATDAENGQRGVWSYNNAVNTLVTACKNATGLTVDGSTVISIRSAGNTNVTYTSSGISGTDAPGDYTYDYQTAGAQSDWYTANGFNNYHMKREDTNYSTDDTVMRALAISRADNGGRYLLASRRVDARDSDVYFYVRYVYAAGNLDGNDVCNVDSYGYVRGYDASCAVRPVVTLSSSASGLNIEN